MILKRLLTILFVLAIVSTAIAEPNLVIRSITGAECMNALKHVGKVVYSRDSLYLYSDSNVLIYCDLLSNVQHIRFSKEQPNPSTNLENVQHENSMKVKVFPNPTQDVVYVENANGKELRLFTMDGHLLETINVGNIETKVNMTNYPKGCYLLFSDSQSFQILKH